jgi:hypothetical protein
MAANGVDAQTTGAQPTGSPNAVTRRAFIEGTAMADYDQTDFEPTGPVFASGFGIGSKLWERYSFRFEYERPTEHVDHTLSPGSEYRWASKTTAYAFLMGRHFRTTKRAQIVLLVGVTALTHRTELTGFLDVVPRDGRPPTHTVFDGNENDVEQWVALSVGAEIPITLSRHLQLVPQVRQHAVANEELGRLFSRGNASRARLSIRWQF